MKKNYNHCGGSGLRCNICGDYFVDGFCGNCHEQGPPVEKKREREPLEDRCLVCNRPILSGQTFCSRCE